MAEKLFDIEKKKIVHLPEFFFLFFLKSKRSWEKIDQFDFHES